MKKIYIILALASSLISISCSHTPERNTTNRQLSSEPTCLERTHNKVKENVYLRVPHRYWEVASMICANPNKYNLKKIFSFHKDLKDKGYYRYGLFNVDIGFYPPLLIAMHLNGNQSKLKCLEDTKTDLDNSNIQNLNRLKRTNKYLIAARLCSG